MTLLSWFPFSPAAWKALVGRLSLRDEGALLRAMREAWDDPTHPCTIEDTDAAFDALFGSEWRKVAPVVRRHFTPCPDAPGRLRSAWLFGIYAEQMERYQKRAAAGRTGGRQPKHSDSNASSNVRSIASAKRRAKLAQNRDGGTIPPSPPGSRGDGHPPGAEGAERSAALTGAPLAPPAPSGAVAVQRQSEPTRLDAIADGVMAELLDDSLPPGVVAREATC